MKIINVLPETHQLAKKLSYKTNKNMSRVVAEALEAYEQSIQGSNRLLNKFLEQVTEATVDAMKLYVTRDIPVAIEFAVKQIKKVQEEELAKAAREAEEMLSPAEQEEIESYERPPEQE